MSIAVMRQALEVLEQINQLSIGENAIALPGEIDAAMDALRAAIEQPRQWVGLTDDEIKEIIGPWGDAPIKGYTRMLFDRIEQKLKEKNG